MVVASSSMYGGKYDRGDCEARLSYENVMLRQLFVQDMIDHPSLGEGDLIERRGYLHYDFRHSEILRCIGI